MQTRFGIPTIKHNAFHIDDQIFRPIGFNYWPASTGVHCWREFDLSHWQEDFELMVKRGYNVCRMFLLWEDFQPQEDHVDPEMLARLKAVVNTAAQAGLWLMPTLFQGWMSGTNFDPAWRKGRNHISDPQMLSAMQLLAGAVAEVLRDAPNILAIDLANEIDAICHDGFTGKDVAHWAASLSQTIKSQRPGTLVTNGTAGNPMEAADRWNYADLQAMDFNNMHGYPMFWTPLRIPCLSDPRATYTFGYMTAFAAAYGPVMRQEFGTAMAADGQNIADFVFGNCMASWMAGSNGFAYWCWSDLATEKLPYDKDPFESQLGYINTQKQPKTWAQGYDRFQQWLTQNAMFFPLPSDVAIYIPEQFKNTGSNGDRAMATAYENLLANGITARLTLAIDQSIGLLVLPCTQLSIKEIKQLHDYVQAGGTVIALNISFLTCSTHWEKLTGAYMADFDRRPQRQWTCNGELPQLNLMNLNQIMPVFDMRNNAKVIYEQDGIPVITVSSLGKGKLVQCIPNIAALEDIPRHPAAVEWWHRLLELSGYQPALRVKGGMVSAVALQAQGNPTDRILLLNHDCQAATVDLYATDKHVTVTLAARDVVEVRTGQFVSTLQHAMTE